MASHVRHCLINLVSGKLNCIQIMWGAGQKIICSWLNIFTPLIMRGYKKQKDKTKDYILDLLTLNDYYIVLFFFTDGDGRLGYSALAPYDVIHVGAAAEKVPQAVSTLYI